MIGGFQVGPFQPLPAYQQGGAPLIVIDTHDGDIRRKRQYEEQRQAAERRRQQITDAVDPQTAFVRQTLVEAMLPKPALQHVPLPQFDFDADDEEVILLL